MLLEDFVKKITTSKLYWLAFISAFVLVALSYLKIISSDTLVMASVFIHAAISIIFMTWLYPYVKYVWNTFIGKFFIVLINVVSGIVSTVQAKNIVSLSIGLPAQDFDIAVTVVGAFHYIPVLLFLSGCIVIIPLIVFAFFALIAYGLMPSLIKKFNTTGVLLFGNIIGAFVISIFFISIPGFFENIKIRKSIEWITLSSAYIGDYQPVNKYPNIPEDARVRLHENGIISFAAYKEGRVVIEVKKLDN